MTVGPDQSIQSFLNAAAAKQPAPGGGSVAALAGALAASMGEMVLNYSVGKKSLAAHEKELVTALGQFNRARSVLVELMIEDQSAYSALSEAKKAGADPTKIAELARTCVAVPESIGATAAAILLLSEKVAGIVNPFLLSDLAVCADLAMATVRCASYNVTVNLPELPSDADRAAARRTMDTMLTHATAAVQRASAAIWSRVKS